MTADASIREPMLRVAGRALPRQRRRRARRSSRRAWAASIRGAFRWARWSAWPARAEGWERVYLVRPAAAPGAGEPRARPAARAPTWPAAAPEDSHPMSARPRRPDPLRPRHAAPGRPAVLRAAAAWQSRVWRPTSCMLGAHDLRHPEPPGGGGLAGFIIGFAERRADTGAVRRRRCWPTRWSGTRRRGGGRCSSPTTCWSTPASSPRGVWLRDLLVLMASGTGGKALAAQLFIWSPLLALTTAITGVLVLTVFRDWLDIRLEE